MGAALVRSDAVDGPAPATRLGTYTLLSELGRGGMGRVWRARQDGLERDIALKTLRAGTLADASARERFQREALAAARLRHPGIVPVYEVGEAQGDLFLAMELVRGETLAARLRAGPLDPGVAAKWLRALADAVQHAHEHGVVHRDLKPSNVLLDADQEERPRLVDFGVARLTGADHEALTTTLEGIGTLAYLAPEQATGRRAEQGPATDVYGLSAALYHCLTGRAPFGGEHPAAVLQAVIQNDPPPLRTRLSHYDKSRNDRSDASGRSPALFQIPRDLETICLKCLEKDPRRRYETAAAVRDELDCYLRGDPVTANPVGWSARYWRGLRRRPALAVSVGLSCLLGFALAGLLWRRFVTVPKSEASAALASLVAHWPLRLPTSGGLVPLQTGGCSAIGPSPCGRWLAAGDQGGLIRIIRLDRREAVATLRQPASIRALDWSGDGEWLVSGDLEGNWRLWHPADSSEAVAGGFEASRVDAIAFRPDREVIFVGHTHTNHLWRRNGTNLTLIRSLVIPVDPTGAFFSPDNTRLCLVGGGGHSFLFDAESGALVRHFKPEAGTVFDYSPASCLAQVVPLPTGGVELRLLRLSDGEPEGRAVQVAEGIREFKMSPDGGRVAVVTPSYKVLFYDFSTGRPVPPTIQLMDQAYRLEFTPDGLQLLTVTVDGVARLWDAATGTALTGPITNPWLTWAVCLTPDGRAVIAPETDSRIRFWDIGVVLPPDWSDPRALATALWRLDTPASLRMAAGLNPKSAETYRALAGATRRAGTASAVTEAKFLDQFASALEGDSKTRPSTPKINQ